MKKYIFLGVIIFTLSLIIFIPAGIVAKLLPNTVAAQNFQGNLWQGSAANVISNGTELGQVDWSIAPSCLLLFKLCASIKQNHTEFNSKFDIEKRSSIEITDLQANGNATALANILQNYGITVSGEFDADLTKATFRGNSVEMLEGKIKFNSLVLNGVLRINVGDVNTNFTPNTDHTQIDISNQRGHVDLAGDIQLYPDNRYQLALRFRENAQTDQTIINGLQYLSKKQADGTYLMQQSGQL